MEDEMKELVFNMMCDLKKKEIEPKARAMLIQNYLDKTGLSGRALAKQLGIPNTTLQDWLLWGNITKEKYDEYIEAGHTHKDIYRSLRGGTLSGKSKAIDVVLNNCISKLEVFKLGPPYSRNTSKLIEELKRILDVIERQVK